LRGTHARDINDFSFFKSKIWVQLTFFRKLIEEEMGLLRLLHRQLRIKNEKTLLLSLWLLFSFFVFKPFSAPFLSLSFTPKKEKGGKIGCLFSPS